ncbi:MAG: HAMP domain-containing histidine kinase [Cardiobacteriaceae bacterium]|nr:HAMP domain-containing histidine kinase [Cardiobacteriaceae bacterium]
MNRTEQLKKIYKKISILQNKSTFHISIISSIIAVLISSILLLYIYASAKQEIYSQIDSRINTETVKLQAYYEQPPKKMRATSIQETNTLSGMFSCVFKSNPKTDKLLREHSGIMLFNTMGEVCSEFSIGKKNKKESKIRIQISRIKNDSDILAVGYDDKKEKAILNNIKNASFIAIFICFLAGFYGSFYISRAITSIVSKISRTAVDFANGNFSARLNYTQKDIPEMEEIANNLNEMLTKINSLILQQKQVTNDIAHDLRSPLTRIHTRLEVAMLSKRSNKELEEVISDSIDDVQKLIETFNTLLAIANTETINQENFSNNEINDLISELGDIYQDLIEEGQKFELEICQEKCFAFIHTALLIQAIEAILDNAVKFNSENGTIRLQLAHNAMENKINITISDNGSGIPEAEFDKVTEKFVRLESSRTTKGNGLGLTLAKAIIKLHKGEIIMQDNNPGLKVIISLPSS